MTDYEAFDAECRELGLDEAYTISSTDVNAYEQSLIPLENLSNLAFSFLRRHPAHRRRRADRHQCLQHP
ncbi:MAG: hypothetical protein V8T10_10180 [Merdibacter sp.]